MKALSSLYRQQNVTKESVKIKIRGEQKNLYALTLKWLSEDHI